MKRFLTIIACAIALLSSCTKSSDGIKMVIIGFDGLGAQYLDSLDMPNLRSAMERGSWTLHKRSVLPSASAINWASTFNGQPTEMHGYTRWNSMSPDMPVPFLNEHGMPETLFNIYRKANPDAVISCTYDWTGIKFVIDSTAFNKLIYARPAGGVDPDYNAACAVDMIKTLSPDLCFCYFDAPDDYGHAYGWGSPEYKARAHQVDAYIAKIEQAVKDAGYYDKAVFVFTSDHGGINKGHGGINIKELEAPFVVWGKGIRKGEIKEFMMQYDAPATMAKILGLESPSFWRGRPVDVQQ